MERLEKFEDVTRRLREVAEGHTPPHEPVRRRRRRLETITKTEEFQRGLIERLERLTNVVDRLWEMTVRPHHTTE